MKKIIGILILIMIMPTLCAFVGAIEPNTHWYIGLLAGFIIEAIAGFIVGAIMLAVKLIQA